MAHRLFILLFLSTLTGCDNDIAPSEVPSVVENTFKEHFANATEVEWESFGKDYEVDFEMENIDHCARVDRSGILLGYKYEIEERLLPSNIKEFIKKKYPQREWEDAELLVIDGGSYYQLEVEGFFRDKKLVMDKEGKTMDNIKYWN